MKGASNKIHTPVCSSASMCHVTHVADLNHNIVIIVKSIKTKFSSIKGIAFTKKKSANK